MSTLETPATQPADAVTETLSDSKNKKRFIILGRLKVSTLG
jgi:hypothetical protein